MHEPVKLIIAHGHPVFRGIPQKYIAITAGFDVIADVGTVTDLPEAAALMQPDIIIADIALLSAESFTLLAKLSAPAKGAKVIISWRYSDEVIVIATMDVTCAGYISHDAPPGDYFFAIRQVMKGEMFYCGQTQKFIAAQKQLFKDEANILTGCMKRN